MTDFGSQRLYQEPLSPVQVAERIELPVDDVEIPTALPPTLDKLINGHDTAPNEDPWLTEPAPPRKPNRKERRAAAKARKRAMKRQKTPFNRREFLSICVEMAGIGAISAGFWQIHPWCGLICLGLCLILMGYAISRNPNGSP